MSALRWRRLAVAWIKAVDLSFPGEIWLGVLRAGLPHFVGQLLAGMIMLALLETHVTHRCFRGQYYRPGSASLPCKVCLGIFGQHPSGTVGDVRTASGAPFGEEPVGSLTFHLSSGWGTLKMALIVYGQGIQP